MLDKDYEKYLNNKLQEEHIASHALTLQLEEERKKNSKHLQQLSCLRKKELENKVKIEELESRIKTYEAQLNANKNQVKKPPVEKTQTQSVQKLQNNFTEQNIDKKIIFKQFIHDNYPKYKEVAKKSLAFVLHIEKHAAKEPKQRIDTYYEIWGGWAKKFLGFVLGKKSEDMKKESIAEKMVEKWKLSENRMRELMKERNEYKIREDRFIEEIEKLEASEAKLIANKNALESKIFAYESSLQLKGAEFVVHLRKMLLSPDEYLDSDKKYIESIIEIMNNLSLTKKQNQSNETDKKGSNENEVQKKESLKEITLEKSMKEIRGTSGVKLRKNAPVLKKNIFGYFESPQFSSNQPSLTLTKHPNLHKAIQTVPEDLSILTLHPIIKLKVIDAIIKPQNTRHNTNFFVRINYNLTEKLSLCTKVCEKTTKPEWNEEFLLFGYTFPFFTVELMNQAKGLKDYSVGDGKIQVSSTKEPKYVNIKNDGEHQGRVQFEITYPKGNIYQFIINSVQINYPESYPFGKDTLRIKFPLNPNFLVQFEIGEKIRYFDDDFRGGNKFLICEGFDEDKINVDFDKCTKKGEIGLSGISEKEGEKEVIFKLDECWCVILSGVLMLIVSEENEPEAILEETEEEKYVHKYFSLIAPPTAVCVNYNDLSLPSHVKMPLVFRFDANTNFMNIYNQEEVSKQKEEPKKLRPTSKKHTNSKFNYDHLKPIQINPIVLPNTNVVCHDHEQQIRAPKIVYEIKLEMVEGDCEVSISSGQFFYEKLLADIELKCGDKRFSIPAKSLLQNFYITINRTFKEIGFIKFKIGYISHLNLLQDKPSEPSQKLELSEEEQPQEIIPVLPLQQTISYFLTVQLWCSNLNEFSTTADYTIEFIYGNCNRSSKRSGGCILWKEHFILPMNVKIILKVTQNNFIGKAQCIYECPIIFTEKDLKLKSKFVTLGTQSYLFLSNIETVHQLYSLQVKKIEAQIMHNSDWIGKIDPYIKFNSLARTLYETEKLQGIGLNPIWENDQFSALIPYDFINLGVYDEDVVGKDDWIGECVIELPELTESVCGVIYKNNENVGKVELNGFFNKFEIPTYPQPPGPSLSLTSLFKVTINSIELNLYGLEDSDRFYLEYESMGLKIKSSELERELGIIKADFCIWIKEQALSQIRIDVFKIGRTFFQNTKELLGYLIIDLVQVRSTEFVEVVKSSLSICNPIKAQNENSLISYIVQPIETARIVDLSVFSMRGETQFVIVSDAKDAVLLGECDNDERLNLLVYDDYWYVLTLDGFAKYCELNYETQMTNILNLCRGSEYSVVREEFSFVLQPIQIHPSSTELKESNNNAPVSVILPHEFLFTRSFRPLPKILPVPVIQSLYELIHISVKCTTTNKPISENSQMWLYLEWETYGLRIGVRPDGENGNLVLDRMMRFYNGEPVKITLFDSGNLNEKSESSCTVVLVENFKKTCFKVGNRPSNLLQVGACCKYKGQNLLISCEFQEIEAADIGGLSILEIPDIFVDLPQVNANDVENVFGGSKNEKANSSNEKFEVLCEVGLTIGIRIVEADKESIEMIEAAFVRKVKPSEILISWRCIKTKGFLFPFPLDENMPIFLSQVDTHAGKSPKYTPACISTSFSIKRTYSRTKTLQIQQKLKEIALHITSLPNLQLKEPNFIQINTDKYENTDLVEFCYEIGLWSKECEDEKEREKRMIGDWFMVEFEEILIDFNDVLKIKDEEIEIRIVHSDNMYERIFGLNLVDRDKKKYALESEYGKNMIIKSEHENQYRVEVWVKEKNGMFGSLGKKLPICVSNLKFENFRSFDTQVCILQLFKPDQQVQTINSKALGCIKLKYKASDIEGMKNQIEKEQSIEGFREIKIDWIVADYKIEKVRIECVQESSFEETTIMVTFADQSTSSPYHYCMRHSILTSWLLKIQSASKWPHTFKLNFYDPNTKQMLGSLNTNEMFGQREGEMFVADEFSYYIRWAKCIGVGRGVSAIVGGGLKAVDLENSLIVRDSNSRNIEMNDKMVSSVSSEKIMCLNISNFNGTIAPAKDRHYCIQIQTKSRCILSCPSKVKSPESYNFSVNLIEKEFADSIIISVCDRKGDIMYSGTVNKNSLVGCVIFYNFKQEGENRMPCGSCTYSVQNISNQTPHAETQLFVEISSVEVEIYQDTELFMEMTPYLTLDEKYSSSLGLGKSDLFWKMDLILDVSSHVVTPLRIAVQDRDLVFDDFLGQCVMLIAPFDISKQNAEIEKEENEGGEKKVLKLGQFTHANMELKNGDKSAGNIKVTYRYLDAQAAVNQLEELEVVREVVEVAFGKEEEEVIESLPKLSALNAETSDFVGLVKHPLRILMATKHVNLSNVSESEQSPVKFNIPVSFLYPENNSITLISSIMFFLEKAPKITSLHNIEFSFNGKTFEGDREIDKKIFGIGRYSQAINFELKGTVVVGLGSAEKDIEELAIFIWDRESRSLCKIRMNEGVCVYCNGERVMIRDALENGGTKIGTAYINLKNIALPSPVLHPALETLLSHTPLSLESHGHLSLRIRIVSAEFEKDIEFFGKMDPYCILYYNPSQFHKKHKKLYQTKTQENKGKYPVWNECVDIYLKEELIEQEGFEWVLMDEEVTIDRVIGYRKMIAHEILQKDKFSEGERFMKIELWGKEDEKVKAGVLNVTVSLPILRHVIFTYKKVYSPLEDIKDWKFTYSEKSEVETCSLHTNKHLETGIIYPLPSYISHIHFLIQYKDQQPSTQNVSIKELFERMFVGNGKIVFGAGIEIGYIFCGGKREDWEGEVVGIKEKLERGRVPDKKKEE